MVKGIYEHFKGNRYRVTGFSLLVGKIHDIETVVVVVEYENKEGQRYSRRLLEFEEMVEQEGVKVPRFRYLPLAKGLNA